jgi:hypothetical protein
MKITELLSEIKKKTEEAYEVFHYDRTGTAPTGRDVAMAAQSLKNAVEMMLEILSPENTNDFTADKARELCSNRENELLQDVIILIKEEAIKAKKNVNITKPLNDFVKKELTKRGFVIESNSINW